MRVTLREHESQKRERIVSTIREGLRASLSEELVSLAQLGRLPEEWMTAAEINTLLEEDGYWATHSDPLAQFLSSETCESLLASVIGELACTHGEAWAQRDDCFKPYPRDWNDFATLKANALRAESPHSPRTAFYTGDGVSILFGHENYSTDPRTRVDVEGIRRSLQQAGIPELGFGLSDDGGTWALAVHSRDEQRLCKVLLEAWQAAFGFSEAA